MYMYNQLHTTYTALPEAINPFSKMLKEMIIIMLHEFKTIGK